MTNKADWDLRHKMIALPCVRIRAEKAGGSGTIIYSGEGEEGFSTYVLTNHHVVAENIKVEKRWSGLLRSERKIDTFQAVDVHRFEYRYESRAIGGSVIQSDVVAYDVVEDLALLRLRSDTPVPSVVTFYPRGKEHELRIGMPVICVGAGLGEAPVQTMGILSQFGIEIDRREFWLSTAPSIFGNSGGALFLDATYEMIGVPARIAVTMGGFAMDAITHLSYSIPITRIYDFLETQKFRFIYDPEFTEAGEREARREIREEEERKRAMASGEED